MLQQQRSSLRSGESNSPCLGSGFGRSQKRGQLCRDASWIARIPIADSMQRKIFKLDGKQVLFKAQVLEFLVQMFRRLFVG